MLTLPKVVERAATPYVFVAEDVLIPFGPAIDKAMPEVVGWLQQHGVQKFGPAIFKYNSVKMPELGMEFGFAPPGELPEGSGRIRNGVLPAGRYLTVTWFGHYDQLIDVTGILIGWARYRGLKFDAEEGLPDGDHFVSRFELYPNGPMDEPDPAKWETNIFFKLRD